MVDISRLAPEESRIYDVVFVEAEEVAITNAEFFVVLLSLVGDRLSNLFANVLYDDVFGLKATDRLTKHILTVGKRRDRFCEFC